MRLPLLLPVLAIAACSSGPSKEESTQIFLAANTAMTSAQSRAVADAQTNRVAPADLLLDFTGPCTLGGTVAITGAYSGDGSTNQATFDLQTSFNGCKELTGTLDGGVHWSSVASGTTFNADIVGDLDWEGNDGSASCELDLHLAISQLGISYAGSMCGYDVTTELTLGPRS